MSNWQVMKKGGRFIVVGPDEQYDFSGKRRAVNVAEGRAHHTMTKETADKIQALEDRQFGKPDPRPTRRAAMSR